MARGIGRLSGADLRRAETRHVVRRRQPLAASHRGQGRQHEPIVDFQVQLERPRPINGAGSAATPAA